MNDNLQLPKNITDTLKSLWIDYKGAIILGITSLGLIGLAFLLIVKSIQIDKPIEYLGFSDNEASRSAETSIKVDIEGGVAKPGVYNLPSGSRIEDAIIIAGGLSDRADAESIAKNLNRAARVVDGAKIYIPVLDGNNTSHNSSFATTDSNSNLSSQNYGSVLQRSGEQSQNGTNNSLNAITININSASESELDTLPGVGPVTVGKIINGRPYNRIEELSERKIVNSSVWEKIKSLISL